MKYVASVSVTLIQIFSESVFFLFSEARPAEQTEQSKNKTQADEYSGISESLTWATVHVYDSRPICQSSGTGPSIQR